ncbi:MAG: HRDC domain-containing protein, partial [Actinomycetota bacterium]|nr:HRDC domain-containing protein [Actinomycetota bacterium]
VTLSTIHRVKGREWDRVAVFGVVEGVVPHRLAEDIEEERRVLHVGITRGRHRVVVLADAARRSPFLDEMAGTAPPPAPPRTVRQPTLSATAGSGAPARRRGAGGTASGDQTVDGIEADEGRVITVLGGYQGTIEALDGRTVLVRTPPGGVLRVRFGERVEHAGRQAVLVPPAQLWGAPAEAETALRAWRTQRAQADGVPAYVVVNDRHLRGIALARPTSSAELVACDGIGPAKLERYGEEILAVIEQVAAT